MNLRDILGSGAREVLQGNEGVGVSDITIDSRAVSQGSLFIALKGATSDGHDFVADAVRNGAGSILVEHALGSMPEGVTIVRSEIPLSEIAKRFFGDPSRKLSIVGVTGTNGKTTTTFLLRSIFAAAGFNPAVLGTVGYFIAGAEHSAPNTTPDAILLNRLLSECVEKKVTHVAMEVSSHALKLGRTDGLKFACGVLTNVTQDHLDFHQDMNDYFESKALLFRQSGHAAVNTDDSYGAEISRRYPRAVTFGSSGAVRAENVSMTIHGTEFEIVHGAERRLLRTRLVGSPNVENCLAAAAASIAIGIPLETIASGLEQAGSPPGRFELVGEGRDFAVAVDYAHTPDALLRLLKTGRALKPSRLFVVFGCGGDRDRTKRPIMGKIASENADRVWVTSDNPRTEDPEAIIDEVVAGMTGKFSRVTDRREAINNAVNELAAGDLLLIAGKGHEDYQIIGRTKIHFDDREVANEAMNAASTFVHREQKKVKA